jgi:UDP-2-acetamido-2-deoxy-ribo-hexuluronate aminotransferase
MSIVSMYDPTRHFNENKKNYMEKINNVLSNGCFINGPEIKEIEEKLLKYVDVKNAIAVSSGTDALLIALMAVGAMYLDEVVTVSFTWISTAEVIKLLGLKPVFCDVDKDTFNMDPLSLQNVITEKTKVVIPVSIFGQIYEVEKIKEIVKNAEIKYNKKIYIIEDAAQSFGSIDNLGRKSCSVGDIGCTSFFPSKPLGCFGDGGMCFTNNDELANKMKMIRNHGCIERYNYKCVGINGRLDTIQAAILLVKFEDFENSLNKRIINAEKYNIAFSKFPFQTPVISKNCSKHVYAQYTIRLNDEKTRNDLLKYLNTNNIGNGVFYPICLHLVDIITKDYKEESLPISEKLAKRVLSIPVYSELTDSEIDVVIYHINNFFLKNK